MLDLLGSIKAEPAITKTLLRSCMNLHLWEMAASFCGLSGSSVMAWQQYKDKKPMYTSLDEEPY